MPKQQMQQKPTFKPKIEILTKIAQKTDMRVSVSIWVLLVAGAMMGGVLLGAMASTVVSKSRPVDKRLPPPAIAASSTNPYPMNEMLVKFAGNYAPQDRAAISQEFLGKGYKLVRLEQVYNKPFDTTKVQVAFAERSKRMDPKNAEPSDLGRWYRVIFTPRANNLSSLVQTCIKHAKTDTCEPDYYASIAASGLNPLSDARSWGQPYANQYAQQQMSIKGAWNSVYGTAGDVNGDGKVDMADVDYLVAYVFKGGPAPDPVQRADLNSDGQANVIDIVMLIDYLHLLQTANPERADINADGFVNWKDANYLLAYLFKNGPAPTPASLADVNGDGTPNIVDLVSLVDLLRDYKTESYLTGDVNHDGVIDSQDIAYLISYTFQNGSPPIPEASGDMNRDGKVNVIDVVLLIDQFYNAHKVGAALMASPSTNLDALSTPFFLPGDMNGDGTVDSSDLRAMILYVFSGGPAPDPVERADMNGDGVANVLDVVLLIDMNVPLPTSTLAGDINGDGQLNQADVDTLVSYLFKDGAAPSPLTKADLNGDGVVNVIDLVLLTDRISWQIAPGSGDVNGDGIVSLDDVNYLIKHIFQGGPEPTPASAGDMDGNGVLDIIDVVRLIRLIQQQTSTVPHSPQVAGDTANTTLDQSKSISSATSGGNLPFRDGTFPQYLYGDVNGDGKVTLDDEKFLETYLFKDGQAPSPASRADLNNDGVPNVLDLVLLIKLLFAHPTVDQGKTDVNGDGKSNWDDVNFLVEYTFRNGPPPAPLSRGDMNNDGVVDVLDIVQLIDQMQKVETKDYIVGDVDNNGVIDWNDVNYLIAYTFKNGPAPIPMASGDMNYDGEINVLDVVLLIDYFRGDGFPAAPKDQTVAVLDTGVDYQQSDLKGNIEVNGDEVAGDKRDNDSNGFVNDSYGWNFVSTNATTLDDNGHGTGVAGAIAAANNKMGIVGTSLNAKILPVKVLGSDGRGSVVNIVRGIRYAVDNGADVLMMGFGFHGKSQLVADAISYATHLGAVSVAAAGNDGRIATDYVPANQTGVISVGAVDPGGKRASFSNYGSKVTVMASGVDILSLRAKAKNGAWLDPYCYGNAKSAYCGKYPVATSYYRGSGTSYAAANVAGIATLVMTKHPEYNPAQVLTAIKNSARGVNGVVDALTAVK